MGVVSGGFSPELTGDGSLVNNRAAVLEGSVRDVASGTQRLPAGWVPEDAAVSIWARVLDDGQWEALIPDFAISGKGRSAEDAAESALHALYGYLRLCAQEDITYEEARRPIGVRTSLAIVGDILSLVLGSRFKPRGRGRGDRFRVPLRAVGVS